VNSHINARFRREFDRLPARIQEQARRAYRLFQANPDHPGLEFKKLPPHDELWSVRVSEQYRAVGRRDRDVIVWFFIGTHAEYDRLLSQ
jgi:mRNA-degrading endonuclease RelE of RelBE toxin-antitoxin system